MDKEALGGIQLPPQTQTESGSLRHFTIESVLPHRNSENGEVAQYLLHQGGK
jgi:hypothetical protein